ncbi:MAG: galactokinase [Myxococcales bacterium]
MSASAPGRVNLIGEHTDYNGGFVLPMAIPQRTHVTLRKSAGRRIVAHSTEMNEPAEFTLGEERRAGGWADYLQGVTWVLARAGHAVSGCELRIRSEVPPGAGLSSSAALCVALLRAVREAFSLRIDDVEIALLAQKVETDFVGAPVGVMDQMASSLADARTALFLDARTLVHEKVALPQHAAILVIDSGIRHSHATGDYRARRAECEEAARGLGVAQLRDVEPRDLERISRLPKVLAKRARHVVTEDARVIDTVAALRAGDLRRAGGLFDESHASLRDDFEVSLPEIDRLVEIARQASGVYGARLTGGGFGGSIVALADVGRSPVGNPRDTGLSIVEEALRAGLRPSLLVPQASS